MRPTRPLAAAARPPNQQRAAGTACRALPDATSRNLPRAIAWLPKPADVGIGGRCDYRLTRKIDLKIFL